MIPRFHISVEAWSAWAPGLFTEEAWVEWANSGAPLGSGSTDRPPVQFIAPLLRRRCSDGVRAALSVAYACLQEPERGTLPAVFASRHGEAQTTLDILHSLARREPMSPMGFSLSVHNASSGIFSIATSNVGAASAISARRGLVASALMEGVTQARASGSSRFLCVFQEEPVPNELLSPPESYPELFAVALLCSEGGPQNSNSFSVLENAAAQGAAPNGQNELSSLKVGLAGNEQRAEVDGLAFLRWYLLGGGAFAASPSLGLKRGAGGPVTLPPFFQPGLERN